MPDADSVAARWHRRAGRFAAQELVWHLAVMGRLRACGREGVLPGGAVRVRATGAGADRRAGFAGLATCGSVWSCPVCSAKILARRQEEIREALDRWLDAGNSFYMLTLTMPHRHGQRLSRLWDGLSAAWRKVVTGGTWKRYAKGSGVAGQIRVTEVTHGANGWHVHLHLAILVEGRPSSPAAGEVRAAQILGAALPAWDAAMLSQGLGRPSRDAQHCKLWTGVRASLLGEYFTKNVYDAAATDAAWELARGDIKEARRGNRTPFRILSDIARYGVADDVELWQEWEQGSKGRRQMTWSRGLRDLLKLGAEASDEQIAGEQLGTEDDDLVELPAASFRMLARNGLRALVLEFAEEDDTGQALARYLAARGVPFRAVKRLVPA